MNKSDPIAKHYDRYPYPDVTRWNAQGPDIVNKFDKMVPPDPSFSDMDILIAGCGTIQGFLAAYHNPQNRFVLCDVSESSMAYTKSLIDQYSVQNVTYELTSIEDLDYKDFFDLVVATGVVHHCEDVPTVLNKIWDMTKVAGIFKGMVYFDGDGRRGQRELNKFFLENGMDVYDVRKYFIKNPSPIWDKHDHSESEIADNWLNPRFREYTEAAWLDELDDTEWERQLKDMVILEDRKLYFICEKNPDRRQAKTFQWGNLGANE